jgi:FtsZ-interacting cell division protein ZipA
MRVNVNLATQKFEVVRLFLWRATVAISLAAAALVVLLLFALWNYKTTSESGKEIKELERQIAHRAFSWTQLFNDLQRIMPRRAYLVSVAPELTEDNKVKLKLTIKGERHEDALELQKRMETSERFRQPKIEQEQPQKETRPGQASTIWTFQIESQYVPPAPLNMRASGKEGL